MTVENEKARPTDLPVSMAGLGTHEKVYNLVKTHLPNPGRVIDLAAGEGAFSLLLVDLGHKVLAVDANRENWKATRIDLRVHNLDNKFAEEILEKNNKFDAVVAIEIIEHMENPFQFARECAKLLKPSGLLFLTSPNVEAVHSRLIFLYTGRLHSFGAYETVRPAHITPIFKWKLEMLLEEANFLIIHEEYHHHPSVPSTSLKVRISTKLARLLGRFVKGEKGENGRIIVARLK